MKWDGDFSSLSLELFYLPPSIGPLDIVDGWIDCFKVSLPLKSLELNNNKFYPPSESKNQRVKESKSEKIIKKIFYP